MDAEFYFAYDERVKWRELAAVRCPVLVVRGADSHLWDDASVDKVLGALTHGCGTKAIIPNAGHWVVRSLARAKRTCFLREPLHGLGCCVSVPSSSCRI